MSWSMKNPPQEMGAAVEVEAGGGRGQKLSWNVEWMEGRDGEGDKGVGLHKVTGNQRHDQT